jgi:hypothetical protein
MRKNAKLNVESGIGTSDSWGFSFEYCAYDNSLAVMILHWYAYVSVWLENKEEKE